MAARKVFLAPLVVVIVATCVRVAFYVACHGRPEFDVPVLDSRFYLETGTALASGHALPARPFFMSPGYTGFVAGCSWIAANPAGLVVALQIAADVVACWCTWRLASRRLGNVGGIVAGLLLALHGTQILFTTRVLDATLGSCLVALLLLAFERLERNASAPSRGALLVTGLLLGSLAVLRSTVLLFLLVAPWLFWRPRSLSGLRAMARSSAWLLLGVALPIAPVTLRNVVSGGEFVLLTSSGGVNFLIGNAAESDGRFTTLNALPLAPGRFDDDPTDGRFERSAQHYAEQQRDHPLTASETSNFYRDLALHEIGAHPCAWLVRVARKLWLFVNAFEIPQVDNVYFLVRDVPWMSSLLIESSRLLWPLALFGAFVACRRRQPSSWLLAFVATYAVAITLFFVTDRYRLWITPAAAVLAATGVVGLLESLRSPSRGRRIGACALLVCCGVGCNINPARFDPSDRDDDPGRDRGGWFRPAADYLDFRAQHNNLAARLLERGEADAALAQCEAGLALAPDDPTLALNRKRSLEMLATKAYFFGDFDRARSMAERWTRCAPSDPEAWNTLGGALLKLDLKNGDAALAAVRKAAALAPDDSKYPCNVALTLVRLGRKEEARVVLRQFLVKKPQDVHALALLKQIER